MSKFKIFVIAFLTVFIFFPAFTKAADVSPQFNPLCWQEDTSNGAPKSYSCFDARLDWISKVGSLVAGTSPNEEAADGWLKDAECGGTGADVEWGKCLPLGKTVASIALGGKRIFYNIGEYIQQFYKIAVSIAGILAAVVIILSGIQWVSSGGNSEMITRAKKRIAGAVVGLLIAVGSWVILNTINPALINLRLPQTYMIRQINMPVHFCSELLDPTKFPSPEKWLKRLAFASKSSESIDPQKYSSLKSSAFDIQLIIKEDAAKVKCGSKYFIEGGGGITCYGSDCSERGEKFKCFPPIAENQKEYSCYEADLGGVIFSSTGEGGCVKGLFSGDSVGDGHGWEWNDKWASRVALVALFSNGKQSAVATASNLSTDKNKKIQGFKIDFEDYTVKAQAEKKDFVGFIIALTLNNACDSSDENRYVDKLGVDIINLLTVSAKQAFSYADLTAIGGAYVSIDVGSIKSGQTVVDPYSISNPQDQSIFSEGYEDV
ncbi:MAG: pilin [Candidatus Magasanikbacteria bacterium]